MFVDSQRQADVLLKILLMCFWPFFRLEISSLVLYLILNRSVSLLRFRSFALFALQMSSNYCHIFPCGVRARARVRITIYYLFSRWLLLLLLLFRSGIHWQPATNACDVDAFTVVGGFVARFFFFKSLFFCLL